MENAKKYLLEIGFDDAHLPELFNDDDKSTYTIPGILEDYHQYELKKIGDIGNVIETYDFKIGYKNKKGNVKEVLINAEGCDEAYEKFKKEFGNIRIDYLD
jgi:hypothetical protein